MDFSRFPRHFTQVLTAIERFAHLSAVPDKPTMHVERKVGADS